MNNNHRTKMFFQTFNKDLFLDILNNFSPFCNLFKEFLSFVIYTMNDMLSFVKLQLPILDNSSFVHLDR